MDNFNLKYSVSSDEDSNVSTTQYMFSNAGIGMDESTQQLNEKCGEIFVERIYDSEVFSFTCVFCDKATFTEISDFFEHFKYFHTKSCCISRKSDPLEINNDENNEEIIKIEDSIHQTDLNKEFETIVKDSNELVTNSDTFLKSEEPNRNLYAVAVDDSNGEDDEECVLENSITTIFHSDDIGDGNRPLENSTVKDSNELATNSDTFLKSEEPNKNLYAVAVDDSNGEDDDECVLENSVTTILHSDDDGDGNSPLENSTVKDSNELATNSDTFLKSEEPNKNLYAVAVDDSNGEDDDECVLENSVTTILHSDDDGDGNSPLENSTVKDLNKLSTNNDISDNYVRYTKSQRLSSKRNKNDSETKENKIQPKFLCEMCDKKYLVQSSLRRHIRLFHKKVDSDHAHNTNQLLNALTEEFLKLEEPNENLCAGDDFNGENEESVFIQIDRNVCTKDNSNVEDDKECVLKESDRKDSSKDNSNEKDDEESVFIKIDRKACTEDNSNGKHDIECVFKKSDRRASAEDNSNGEDDEEYVLENSVTTMIFSDKDSDSKGPLENLYIKLSKDKSINIEESNDSEMLSTEKPNDKRIFSCTRCEKKYSVKSCLRRHIRNVHISPNDFVKCSHCDRSVKRYYLKEHERIHTSKKEFKCKFCNNLFKTSTDLKEHEQTHSGDKTPKSRESDKKASTENDFKVGNGDKLLSGDDEKDSTFEEHRENVEATTYTDPKKCKYCGLVIQGKAKRIEHERIHTGERPFKCKFCDKCFRTATYVKKHELTHSGVKPHKCHICNAAFLVKTNLQQHIRRHLGDNKLPCQYCGKMFQGKTDRDIHERRHTGEKPFQCSECGKCYPARDLLRRHSFRHTNDRRYKCELCEKRFYSNRDLMEHKVAHTGEKPFKCDICNSTFSRRKSLKAHIKLHSENAQYLCPICGKGFKQRPGLYCHIKRHGPTKT